MSKSLVVLFTSLVAFGVAQGTPLSISASGQFSSSDTVGQLVAPGGQFALDFTVDSNPTPIAGSVNALGFDVPFSQFTYELNGAFVSAAPTEIRFNTSANGGLFDILFGSNLAALEFSYEGGQLFSGTTATPVIQAGSYSVASWTYSDANNYDQQSPAGASVLVSSTPEPSSSTMLACGLLLLTAAALGKSSRTRL